MLCVGWVLEWKKDTNIQLKDCRIVKGKDAGGESLFKKKGSAFSNAALCFTLVTPKKTLDLIAEKETGMCGIRFDLIGFDCDSFPLDSNNARFAGLLLTVQM